MRHVFGQCMSFSAPASECDVSCENLLAEEMKFPWQFSFHLLDFGEEVRKCVEFGLLKTQTTVAQGLFRAKLTHVFLLKAVEDGRSTRELGKMMRV